MEVIETTDAFKALIENIKTNTAGYKDPLAFGIARVDLGQLHPDKSLQATYPIINWNENFGSAAIFVQALADLGISVDFSQSEQVFDINLDFLQSCLNAFTPYSDEAFGDAHKNIQVVSALYNQMINDG
ncbi:MAG: tetrahydrodipicolinate N-succinyltransferase N-terminal domain-containing protein, partial [Campylobacterales bacterium]|nr:tetrahydrodipicolinate N-succinyltransferase N-terminal domain-containing protein [Campylobacterales bacterium]